MLEDGVVGGGVVDVVLEELVSLLVLVRNVKIVETVPVGCSCNGRQTWRQLLVSPDLRWALSEGKIRSGQHFWAVKMILEGRKD